MLDEYLTSKLYSVAEAARLVHTAPQNVRRWLHGYAAPGHHMTPVLGEPPAKGETLSFLQLAELAVVARYREADGMGQRAVPLDRLRRAHAYARERLGIPYPFAWLGLRMEGGHVLHDFARQNPGPGTLALDKDGQFVLPMAVDAELERFDYEAAHDDTPRFTERWFPFGRAVPIVVDPHVGSGGPTIEGTRVPLVVIKDRFKAGESIAALANDFRLSRRAVEDAVRFAA